jgi:predicted nucleotidyltransferase
MIQLTRNHYIIIKKILRSYYPDAEIWLFGSRISGGAKKYSDLDILIKTASGLKIAEESAHYNSGIKSFNIKADFSDSYIPFKIDLVNWRETSEEFRDEILPSAVKLEEAEKLCVDSDA